MITLKAEKRNPNVKAKKLRREGYVTGILSGKEMKEPVALQFDGAEAAKFIKPNTFTLCKPLCSAFCSCIITHFLYGLTHINTP